MNVPKGFVVALIGNRDSGSRSTGAYTFPDSDADYFLVVPEEFGTIVDVKVFSSHVDVFPDGKLEKYGEPYVTYRYDGSIIAKSPEEAVGLFPSNLTIERH